MPVRISSRSAEISCDSSRVRPGASPSQNGIVGRRPVRIVDAHPSGFDAPDFPRRGPQQEHIADHALDREIFIQRSDDRAFRLGDHLILRGIRESRRRW